jgi:hypothetical protein
MNTSTILCIVAIIVSVAVLYLIFKPKTLKSRSAFEVVNLPVMLRGEDAVLW